MPNYVTNRITFVDCDDEKFNEIQEFVKSSEDENFKFDFNKLIPMPKALDIVEGSITKRGSKMYSDFTKEYMLNNSLSKVDIRSIPKVEEDAYLERIKKLDKNQDIISEIDDYWNLGKQANLNLQEYGYSTWYSWRISNWGTKWNALDSLIYKNGKDMCIEFDTAWSPASPVIEKLSELFPNNEIKLEWADESFGNTCGRETYIGGQLIDEYFPDYGAEQIPLYCDIHGLDEDEFRKEIYSSASEEEQIENNTPSEVMADEISLNNYPVGSRIELEATVEDIHPVEAGSRGTVQTIDDIGTIFVQFDNGRLLGLIPEEDSFRLLTEEEVLSEQIENNTVDRDELANRLVEFAEGYDPYEFNDNYGGERPEKAFEDMRSILNDEYKTEELINYFKKEIIANMEDSNEKNEATKITETLEKLKDELSEENKIKIEQEKERLNKEVLKTAQNFQENPDSLMEFFDFQSKFHNYSIRNQMLIYKQNPYASFCASFNQHKKEGHIVKKGEHGMKILVPVRKTYLILGENKSVNLKEATKEQKAAYRKGEIKAVDKKYYKIGTVFDISQTNCPKEDYPKLFDIGYESKQHAELFKIIKNYCETKLGVPVEENAYSSVSVRGEYNVLENKIQMSANFDDTTKLSILTHEMGHAMLHNDMASNKDKPACQKEFEADALSIMLSKKMGIEIPEMRKDHISSMLDQMVKFKDYKPEMITQSLNHVNKAYGDVMKEVGQYFTRDIENTQSQDNSPILANEVSTANQAIASQSFA